MTLKEYFDERDVFLKDCGAELTRCEPGLAEIRLKTEPKHLSLVGRPHIHAGVLYTLAESASAAAMLGYGWNSYAVDGTITYLDAAAEGEIIVTAKGKDAHDQQSGQCKVRVTTADGKILAQAKFTVFYTGDTFVME